MHVCIFDDQTTNKLALLRQKYVEAKKQGNKLDMLVYVFKGRGLKRNNPCEICSPEKNIEKCQLRIKEIIKEKRKTFKKEVASSFPISMIEVNLK